MNPNIFQHLGKLFEALKHSRVSMPTISSFPPDKCLPSGTVGEEIVKNEDYFSLEINELYLAYDRRWWSTYDPAVLIITEFLYNKTITVVPKIVGPAMIGNTPGKLPLGVVLHDTRAVGPYPYRGGRISVTVVLYRVRHDSAARRLLHFVEQVSSAVGVPADYGTLTKVGHTILEGVESLMGMGETEPVAGHRVELDGERLQGLRSASTVLISANDQELNNLWVESGRLRTWAADKSEAPFEAADYVLYTLQRHSSRGDEMTLPFYTLYEQAIRSAMLADDEGESWKQAKASLLTLYQQMVVSPDITDREADRLFARYTEDLKEKREIARNIQKLGQGTPDRAPADRRRLKQAVSVLDL